MTDQETPNVVTPIVETESRLTEPLIEHASKIAHIEERQAQHETELVRQLSELEQRLQTATGSQIGIITDHISRLEARIEELAKPPEPVAEEIQDTGDEVEGEGVEFETPEVEQSPAPPEKVRRGIRHRKKARRVR